MSEIDLLCIGTALVDTIIKGFDPEPVSASGFRAGSCVLCPGGEAVNEAVTASRLGLRTAIMTRLGNDSAGGIVSAVLEENGVDTSAVLRDNVEPTPVTVMFVNADGSRKSITNSAHRYNFHPELYTDRFEGARAVSIGSLFRAPFDDPAIIFETLSAAKASGAVIYADTKLPNFRSLTLEDIKDSLPLIDYIFPNEDEARYYTGKEEPDDMAGVFLDHGVKNVIVKLGAQGCLLRNSNEHIRFPAFKIDAVDATGAGDCFLAGFIAMRAEGNDHTESLRFANACGAVCTTAAGATTALKDKEQVIRFLSGMSL